LFSSKVGSAFYLKKEQTPIKKNDSLFLFSTLYDKKYAG